MPKWKDIAYRMLIRYDHLCTVNNCRDAKKLNKELSLLIEDLRKNVPAPNEKDRLLDCVKNVGNCAKCGFNKDRADDAFNILLLMRAASKSFDDLKALYESSMRKIKLYKCEKCQFFDIVGGDFAVAVAISQNPSLNFPLKPSSRINPHGVMATEICTSHNSSCEDIPLLQAALEDAAQEYLARNQLGEKKSSTIRFSPPPKKSFLFEDEETKMEKILANSFFRSVLSIDEQPSSVMKMEYENVSRYLSILKLFDVIDSSLEATILPARWKELLESKNFSQLQLEIKLLECARIIEATNQSYYLFEKLDALEFLFSHSKKSKEEILAKLRSREKLTPGESFILEKIKQ